MQKTVKMMLVVMVAFTLSIAIGCKKEDKIAPSVTTSDITAITTTTATAGGNVTDDGGADVTARGVCYSWVNANPTISDNKTTNGKGTGNYSSLLTGLLNNTQYYVRAYATNEVGTTYGAVKTFNTNP